MKRFFISLSFVFFMLSISAQSISMMQNLDFESDWYSIPFTSFLGKQVRGWYVLSAEPEKQQSKDAQHGLYAVRLAPGLVYLGLNEQFFINGSLLGSDAIERIPESMSFYVKGFLQENDSAYVSVELLKNGEELYYTCVELEESNLTDKYQKITVDIGYEEAIQPDTIIVLISCGTALGNIEGSYMYVDNMEFTYKVNITDYNENKSKVRIYPNPSNGQVYISAPQNAGIRIYDISGKMIENRINIDADSVLDLTLSSGMYFVQIQTGDNITTKKLIIQ